MGNNSRPHVWFDSSLQTWISAGFIAAFFFHTSLLCCSIVGAMQYIFCRNMFDTFTVQVRHFNPLQSGYLHKLLQRAKAFWLILIHVLFTCGSSQTEVQYIALPVRAIRCRLLKSCFKSLKHLSERLCTCSNLTAEFPCYLGFMIVSTQSGLAASMSVSKTAKITQSCKSLWDRNIKCSIKGHSI